MGNTRRAMRRTQRIIRTYLRHELGYQVHTIQHTRHGKNDVFGCDMICIKEGAPVLFVQATSHTGIERRVEELEVFAYPEEHAMVQIWQFKGGQRKLDKRYKDKKVWTKNQYLFVYDAEGDRIDEIDWKQWKEQHPDVTKNL